MLKAKSNTSRSSPRASEAVARSGVRRGARSPTPAPSPRDIGNATIPLKGVLAILDWITPSQVENMCRSEMTTPAVPASGRGRSNERQFDCGNLFELALGAWLLKRGYLSGRRLRALFDLIVKGAYWQELRDPATRPSARGFLFLLTGPTESAHFPIFEFTPADLDTWLTGSSPGAPVIALRKLFDHIEERFRAFLDEQHDDADET
jgi:hypothetical protein